MNNRQIRQILVAIFRIVVRQFASIGTFALSSWFQPLFQKRGAFLTSKFWKPVLTLTVNTVFSQISRNFFFCLNNILHFFDKIKCSFQSSLSRTRNTTEQNRTNFSYIINHEMPTLKIYNNYGLEWSWLDKCSTSDTRVKRQNHSPNNPIINK